MIALLAAHTGGHAASHAAPLAALPLFFRRGLRMPWRKPAVPAAVATAGAAGLVPLRAGAPGSLLLAEARDREATPADGMPVLRDGMLGDVRREWTATSAAVTHADAMHAASTRYLPPPPQRRPVNGRPLGTMPRKQVAGHPPWATAAMPALPSTAEMRDEYRRQPAAGRLAADRDAARAAGARDRARYEPASPALLRQVLNGVRKLDVTAGLSFDCGNGLHAPLCSGRNCSCECHK